MSLTVAVIRLALVKFALATVSVCAADQSTYNVYPEDICSAGEHCLTLLDIMNGKDQYMTSNVTLFLTPGNHTLYNELVSVANISNLTLHGPSRSSGDINAAFTCVNSTLTFADVFNLHIASIKFVSCRIKLSSTAGEFQDCSFENSSHGNIYVDGGAVAVYNNSDIQFQDCRFVNNEAYQGGAVAVLNSKVHFLGLTTSTGNKAVMCGGTVFANYSHMTFSESTTFEENISLQGGAVCALENNEINFIGDSNFSSNTATAINQIACERGCHCGRGGALFVWKNNAIRFNGKTTFKWNTATENVHYCDQFLTHGGALCAIYGNTIDFSGNISFIENVADVGGALECVLKDNKLDFRGNIHFIGNTANYGGGAVAVYRSDTNFQDCVFVNNHAGLDGGAVLAFNSKTHFSGLTMLVNNKAIFGGALYTCGDSVVTFSGTNILEENMSRFGGAVYITDNTTASFSGHTTFNRNGANTDGGAIYVEENNKIHFSGYSIFSENIANRNGGGLYIDRVNTLNFTGNSSFSRNTANTAGGVLYVYENSKLHFSEYSSFSGNTANRDGGVLYAYEGNRVHFSGYSIFNENTANRDGGGFFIYRVNTLNFTGNNTFSRNTANTAGGVLYVYEDNKLHFSEYSSFNDNTANSDGGVMYAWYSNTVEFSRNNKFCNNTANLQGGALYAQDNNNICFSGNNSFKQNQAQSGGGIYDGGGTITFYGTGSFIDNSAAVDGQGGAILVIDSDFTFDGSYFLADNTAGFGGGMALQDTVILFQPNTNISFLRNSANQRGGAIYVLDDSHAYCNLTSQTSPFRDVCVFQFSENYDCMENQTTHYNDAGTYTMMFVNNTASISGDTLYGGQLERCSVCVSNGNQAPLSTHGLQVWNEITNSNAVSELEISSNPYKVCVCVDNKPDCNQTRINVDVYGQLLNISVVSVGQLDGVVPSTILAVPDNETVILKSKNTQAVGMNKQCTELHYLLLSNDSTGTLALYSDEPCSTSGLPLTVDITFLPCPVGFSLRGNDCDCDQRLLKYTQICTFENLAIRREQGDSFYVGVDSDRLILHPHCPFDYCTDKALNLTLNNTDVQCSHGRSGILCGACQSGHSLALGNSRCLSGCSNKYLALLLGFAGAGIALVAILFLCQLNLAGGTLSGLIFYANMLAVNQTIFFPSDSTNVLTVFIAWLNLDLGIETCFFVGLDTYFATWLQFVFPIYIWVLVGAIIILAEYITTFAKLISRANPVAVLATLFLLSYAKLLRAIMVAFSFTALEYPNNEKIVWLYDGNIGYFKGKHIVLFLFSLLAFLFVFLPYTLLLLCGQWIMKKLQLIRLSPRKQIYLKSFLDAYYAPFNDRHRYWTGLLLVLRFFILLTSTIINIGSPHDPIVNLAVLLGILSGMLVWIWLFIQKLYKKWYLDVLEASFILNLIVLIGVTFTIRVTGGNQSAVVYTSVSVAFVTFIGIVVGSVAQQVKEIIHRRFQANQTHQEPPNECEPSYDNVDPGHHGVTSSVVSLSILSEELCQNCNTNQDNDESTV